jgi:hypothetical protein
MDELTFPEPDRTKTIEKVRGLEVYGKPLRSSRNLACKMCGRSVLPLGRLAWPGAPLCTNQACELVSLSRVTGIFTTPYGRAMNQQILRIFCRTLEKDRILIQRQPVIDRAEAMVDGYLDLLAWQRAYHDYDRLTHPEAYARGSVSIVPPRRLDEVLVFRASGDPATIDPTRQLPSEISRLLHQVRRHGPTALAVPF